MSTSESSSLHMKPISQEDYTLLGIFETDDSKKEAEPPPPPLTCQGPVPEQTPSPALLESHSGLESPIDATKPETPEWLPPGWRMIIRTRRSGASAGIKDKYFFDPLGRRYRSKKEILSFLENESSNRNSGENSKKDSEKKRKRSNPSNLELNNPPLKVKWVLNTDWECTIIDF